MDGWVIATILTMVLLFGCFVGALVSGIVMENDDNNSCLCCM
jgi:hypothetical protein